MGLCLQITCVSLQMYVSTCKIKQHDSCWLFSSLGVKWFTLWTVVLKKCSETGSFQITSAHPLKTMQLYIFIETWVEQPRKNQWFSFLSCTDLFILGESLSVFLIWVICLYIYSSLLLISLQMANRYFWSYCFHLPNRVSLHSKCAPTQCLLWDNLNPLCCCIFLLYGSSL